MAQLYFNDQPRIGRFIEVPFSIKEKSTGNKLNIHRVASIWESPLEKNFNIFEGFNKIIKPSLMSNQFYQITFKDGTESIYPVDDIELIYMVGNKNA